MYARDYSENLALRFAETTAEAHRPLEPATALFDDAERCGTATQQDLL